MEAEQKTLGDYGVGHHAIYFPLERQRRMTLAERVMAGRSERATRGIRHSTSGSGRAGTQNRDIVPERRSVPDARTADVGN